MMEEMFEHLGVLGEGGFARIYRGRDRSTGRIVALKVGKTPNAHNKTLNEIEKMRMLSHENIVTYLGNCTTSSGEPCIVMEHIQYDLYQIITNRLITPEHLKSYSIQLLLGVEYLHSHGMMHRDLKPANCLVSPEGELKLCDFGLAKNVLEPVTDSLIDHSNPIGTRFYSAPEILYGDTLYGQAVDIWAVGCIMAEMVLTRVLFKPIVNAHIIDQLKEIFKIKGTPDNSTWPGVSELPWGFYMFPEYPGKPLKEVIMVPSAICTTMSFVEMLDKMLHMFPGDRLTCTNALKMDYFREEPAPTLKHLLKRLPSASKGQ